MQKHVFLQRLVLAKGAVEQLFVGQQFADVAQDVLEDCLLTVEPGCTGERIHQCCDQVNRLRNFMIQETKEPNDLIGTQERMEISQLSLLLYDCVIAEMKTN